MLRRLICFLIFLPAFSFAIELGPVQVHTPLYQPLRATITVQQLHNIPVKELQVGLASQHAFQQAGLVKTHLVQQLQLAVHATSKGHALIEITSNKAIQEPYVSVLLKVSWLQGEYVKKYTLLLDPPAQIEATQTKTQTRLIVEKPKVKTVQRHYAPAAKIYGPTKHHETLWQVAKKIRPNTSVTMAQTMLALVSLNPNAFQKHNIHGLMSGFYLRVPSLQQIKSIAKNTAERDLRQHKRYWQKNKTVKLHTLPMVKPAKVASTPIIKPEIKATAPAKIVDTKLAVQSDEIVNLKQDLDKALQANNQLLQQNQQLQAQLVALQQTQQKKQQTVAQAPKQTIEQPAQTVPKVITKPMMTSPKKQPGAWAMVMDFWWQILVILALLIFLIIWRMVRKRSHKPTPTPNDSGPELVTEVITDKEPALDIQSVEAEQTEQAPVDMNSILPEVTVKEVHHKKPAEELQQASVSDVLHEAKLYIDYGRNEQAKEMLQSVAATEPEDSLVWEELLVLYAELNDSKGLARLISKISPTLLKDEQGALWQKIQALRERDEKSAIDLVATAISEDVKEDEKEVIAEQTIANEEQIELTLLDDVTAEAANDDESEEDMMVLPAGDETQLDLATAYIAMEDIKAAKKILNNLLQSNNAGIKEKAEALLASLER